MEPGWLASLNPWWFKLGIAFALGVLAVLLMLVLAAVARRKRIAKAGLPNDPDQLKKLIDGHREESKNLQARLKLDHERFRNVWAG